MNGKPHPPEELESALANIRLIREVMDKVRTSHPIREIMRPLFMLGFWFAPLFVVYGIICQWALDHPARLPLGLGKVAWISIASGVLFCVSGFAKVWFSRRDMNRHGYEYWSFIQKLLLEYGYLRIVLSSLSMIAVGSIVAAKAGHAHQIPGIAVAGIGTVLLLVPLTLPLPELTSAGLLSLFLGAFSIFVFPSYPFYKISVFFGMFNILMGLQGLKMSKPQNSPQDSEVSGQSHG